MTATKARLMSKKSRFAVVAFLALCAWPATADKATQSLSIVATPAMMEPAYLAIATDPAFGTSFVKITAPGQQLLPGLRCGAAYCTHRYSSAQAWNADQSLLVIANGCNGLCFLDGRTYKPLFSRPVANECEWHPTDPNVMICVLADQIYSWNPRLDTRTRIFSSTNYANLQFGPYKGNPSRDGSRLVVRATRRGGSQVAFAYDIATRTKYADINLGLLQGKNNFCSISPSGLYILCDQTSLFGHNTAYVFDINGRQRQHWTEHHRPGHGDMTIDADGRDVYVGVSKSDPDKYHVVKRSLVDGLVTSIADFGDCQHASTRSINRAGWVFLTYIGSYQQAVSNPNMLPFYQEVVALRIDGSGEVRRIVQTRNAKYDYWSESHASPSPDGSFVIWSSNWGRPGGPVADYVAKVEWPAAVMSKLER